MLTADTTIRIELIHNGKSGTFDLTFLEWNGNTIEIDFKDGVYDNAGRIRIDGSTGRAAIEPQRSYARRIRNPEEFDAYFESIIQIFVNNYRFGWSPDPSDMITYDESYHERNNYTAGDPQEIAIKQVQAQIIHGLASPSNVVVAGCSNGELVRRLRERGIAASGFDVIPNVQAIAFEEVQPYLRFGSLTSIPFDRTDKLDTLVAIDVLEHIPERDIPRMVEEWCRLGVSKLVLLINLNQFWFPGHVTLRPLSWWEQQFKDDFTLMSVAGRFPHLPTIYSNSGLYNQQWTLWRRRQPM